MDFGPITLSQKVYSFCDHLLIECSLKIVKTRTKLTLQHMKINNFKKNFMLFSEFKVSRKILTFDEYGAAEVNFRSWKLQEY